MLFSKIRPNFDNSVQIFGKIYEDNERTIFHQWPNFLLGFECAAWNSNLTSKYQTDFNAILTSRCPFWLAAWSAVCPAKTPLTLHSSLATNSSTFWVSPFAAALTSSSVKSPDTWVSNSFLSRADSRSPLLAEWPAALPGPPGPPPADPSYGTLVTAKGL